MNKHWDETTTQAEPPAPIAHSSSGAIRAEDDPAAGALHLRELGYMLWRRSRLILRITLYGTIVMFAVGLLIPPKYTARTEIEVDLGDQQAANLARNDAAIETHLKKLRSRDHLQRVADSLQGNPAPNAVSSATEPADLEEGIGHRPLLHNVASSWLPGPSELASRLKMWIPGSRMKSNEAALLDELERRLRVDREGRSQIIDVSYTSPDPETAAIVANRVAALYIEAEREEKRSGQAAELAQLDRRLVELRTEIDQSAVAVQRLVRQRSDTTRSPDELRDSEQRLDQLQSETAAKIQLYQMRRQRQQELRSQQESMTTDVHMRSLAPTPDRPSSANPFLFIFPALTLFLICGVLLSVILESLDRGLRGERETEKVLGIPCIGLLPQLPESDQASLLRRNGAASPSSAYAEALRAITAAMHLVSPWRQPRVILITSSVPGEGKRTLAANLSASIALQRRRVLLIDFGSGEPSVPLQTSGGQHGVIDLFLESTSPAEVARSIPELGIDYLAMNQCPSDPARFLVVEMSRLIQKLRDSYDCVVIKGPPVFGNSETRLLATLADETLFVVRWGSTRREFAQNALRLLRNDCAPADAPQLPSVRAVITEVDLKRHALYGFGDIGEYFAAHPSPSSGPGGADVEIPTCGRWRALLNDARKTGSRQDALRGRGQQADIADSRLKTRIARTGPEGA
jgi:polysaccharide biosynthesis transport protein